MLRPRVILFLSTGDTCRSPMAATYLRHLLDKHGVRGIEVRTAGVSTIVGLLASQETLQVLRAEELDSSRHRSNQLSTTMLQRADLVLGMTPFHVQKALRMCEAVRGKVFLLKEFTKSDLKKVQIDDPMGGTLEIYRKCFTEIKDAIDRLIYQPEAIGAQLSPPAEEKKPAAPKVKSDGRGRPAAAKRPTAKSAPKPAAKKKAAKPAPRKKATAKPAPKKAAKKTVKKASAKSKSAAKSGKKRLSTSSGRR